jgi:hypothetical protein
MGKENNSPTNTLNSLPTNATTNKQESHEEKIEERVAEGPFFRDTKTSNYFLKPNVPAGDGEMATKKKKVKSLLICKEYYDFLMPYQR